MKRKKKTRSEPPPEPKTAWEAAEEWAAGKEVPQRKADRLAWMQGFRETPEGIDPYEFVDILVQMEFVRPAGVTPTGGNTSRPRRKLTSGNFPAHDKAFPFDGYATWSEWADAILTERAQQILEKRKIAV